MLIIALVDSLFFNLFNGDKNHAGKLSGMAEPKHLDGRIMAYE
tara:strand:+ start:301 stop:429 length:129 start_codon:yes stop_codon:yes gene_type:complete